MAKTKKCPDCGKDVSKSAQSCPNCGAPIRRSLVKMGCASIFLLFAVIMVVASIKTPPRGAPGANAEPTVKVDCTIQEERKKLIGELLAEGAFHKIEHRSITEVWVTPEFMVLSIDDKSTFIELVAAAAFCLGNEQGLVTLTDFRSGKPVGSYSFIVGLRMN